MIFSIIPLSFRHTVFVSSIFDHFWRTLWQKEWMYNPFCLPKCHHHRHNVKIWRWLWQIRWRWRSVYTDLHPSFSDEKIFRQQSDRYITAIVSKGNRKVSIPPSLEVCLGIRVRISSHSWRSFCKLAPAPKIIKNWIYFRSSWSTTLVWFIWDILFVNDSLWRNINLISITNTNKESPNSLNEKYLINLTHR